jgi:hypothetical protein
MDRKKVLTEAELQCLLEIPTTVEGAQMILKRNQKILELLEKGKGGQAHIGCPHCINAGGSDTKLGNCTVCKYPKPDVDISQLALLNRRCVEHTFGGVALNDLNYCIGLTAVNATVKTPSFRRSLALVKDDVEKAITWTRGHIEWAQEVIRRAQAAHDRVRRRKLTKEKGQGSATKRTP